MDTIETVILLLGSNLGDRAGNLKTARLKLEGNVGEVLRTSSIYESEPWGMESDFQFFNQCVSILTSLDPHAVLNRIHAIELEMGRKRVRGEYNDRLIDIDILFFGEMEIFERDLTIPHPRLCQRKFALLPLLEIYPDFQYPATHEKLQIIMDNCRDHLSVRKIG